jgi:hypothetical protein
MAILPSSTLFILLSYLLLATLACFIGITVESRLSGLNGTEGRSDNRKCLMMRKTNEKDEGKYPLYL